jgi:thiol-disulfide isomerase/thioredoxin
MSFKLTKRILIFSFFIVYIILTFNIIKLHSQQSSPYAIGDNIIRDIKLQTELMNIKFDVDKLFRGKPTLLIAVMTTCPYCNKELEYISNTYKDYYGLFNVIIAVTDWNNSEKLRQKYGDTFVYIPVVISNLKKVSSVPFAVFADKLGNVVDTHQGLMSDEVFKSKISKIIK